MPVQELNGIPVLRYGHGDMTVGRLKSFDGNTVGVALTELHESLPIGTEVINRNESNILSYIVFDKIESLDVWLQVLNEVKAHMVAQEHAFN